MTVGSSGEYTIVCGGMAGTVLSVLWEERLDLSANASVMAVTGLVLTAADAVGRYSLGGTVSVDGRVAARLDGSVCYGDVTEAGGTAELSGGFPYLSHAIVHAADGTGSAALSVQLTGQHEDSGQGFYAQGTLTIPLTALSQLSAVEAAAGTIGSPMTFVITAFDPAVRHELRYTCGDRAGVLGSELEAGVHVLTLPMELCNAVTDSMEGSCEIFCDSYRDGVLLGTAACTVGVRVPDSVGLTFGEGWLQLQSDNDGTAAEGLDCFVQGISRVRAVVDESCITYENAYGAALAAVTLSTDGGVVTASGELPVVCTATDTRGRVTETEQSIAVLPYAAPVIVDRSLFRCDETGAANPEGDYVSVTAEGRCSDLDGRSTAALSVRLRPLGGEWGAETALTDGAAAVLAIGAGTYEAELRVTDGLGNVGTAAVVIPTRQVFFRSRPAGRGGAFGMYPTEDDVLDIAWSLRTKGDLTVEGTATIGGRSLTDWLYPVGTVCVCGGDTDPAAIYGGTWAAADTVQYRIRTA